MKNSERQLLLVETLVTALDKVTDDHHLDLHCREVSMEFD